MWDLPGPGLEPVSPALAGGFLTTAPPGKPLPTFLMINLLEDKYPERTDSRSKKNCNPAACGTKTTFTERQDEKAQGYVPDEGTR